MNKKHWNTINLDGTVPDKEIFLWIDHSYELVDAKK
jgi:predicted DNA-binding protein (MmcQ/YjbR family)